MNSFSETKSQSREGQDFSDQKFIGSEKPAQKTKNVEIMKNIPEIQNRKSRNNPETCGVHIPVRKTSENNSVDSIQVKQSEIKDSQLDRKEENAPSTKKSTNFQKQAQEIKENKEITNKLKHQETVNQPLISKGMDEGQGEREDIDNMTDLGINTLNTNLNVNESLGCSMNNNAKDTEERILVLNNDSEVITVSDTLVNLNDKHQNRSETEKLPNPIEVKSSSPLPDISSTWPKEVSSNQKTTKNGTSVISDKQSESPLLDKTLPPGEKFSKSRVHLSQSPYISHSINSDSSSHDAEVELKSLNNLQSLRINQSIYKLAYDESITDQSEADSRSLSPVDPVTQVPKSLVNDEILIHEADSCSDAGSEDVELLPHRYESETFLNESKHMYVNKLSLAVELLRTQENLPYDEQFKRVGRNNSLIDANPDAMGEINLGCVDDFDLNSENLITSQSQARSNPSSSGVVSSFSFEDGSCEEAKEVVVEAANTRICTMCSVS